MKTVVAFSGFRETDRALAQFSKATARATLYRVLLPAAKMMDEAWRADAPRRTGRLAKGGGIVKANTLARNDAFSQAMRETGGDRAAAGALARVNLRASAGERPFAEYVVGPGRHPEGVQQEFGNVNHPAQPFMRPAWESNKERALTMVAAALGAEISKTAARIAVKAAKAAGR